MFTWQILEYSIHKGFFHWEGSGPITRRIQEVFHGAVRGEVDRYKDWLEHVG